MTRPMMMTITGPSCAGKGYLLEKLLKNYPDKFCSLLTYTTRQPRAGEVEGFEYNFISEDEFKQRNANDELCQMVNFHGTLYGTPRINLTDAFASGLTPLRIVEPTGVQQFAGACLPLGADVFSVYVGASPEVIMQRWLTRFLDDVYDADDDGDQHGVVTEIYAKRLVKSFQGEQQWIDVRPYNFYLDCEKQDFASALYSLARISTGNINISVASRISPYPHKEAS